MKERAAARPIPLPQLTKQQEKEAKDALELFVKRVKKERENNMSKDAAAKPQPLPKLSKKETKTSKAALTKFEKKTEALIGRRKKVQEQIDELQNELLDLEDNQEINLAKIPKSELKNLKKLKSEIIGKTDLKIPITKPIMVFVEAFVDFDDEKPYIDYSIPLIDNKITLPEIKKAKKEFETKVNLYFKTLKQMEKKYNVDLEGEL